MQELVHLPRQQNSGRPKVGTQGTAAPRDGDVVRRQPENQRAANLHVLVLGLATFAISTGTFIVTGLLPGVANDLSVSMATAGHLVTVFAVAFALSSPLLVALTARVARRRLLVITLALFALTNVAAAAAPTFSLLLATRAASACCAAICMPVAIATAAQLAPAGHKGRALSIAVGGISAAWVVGAFGSRARRPLRMAGKLHTCGRLDDACLHRRRSAATEGEKRSRRRKPHLPARRRGAACRAGHSHRHGPGDGIRL